MHIIISQYLDNILLEMANLDYDQTGVEGFIYISTEDGSHSPRVKYYKKLGKSLPSASISISDNPKIFEGKENIPNSKIRDKIFEFIKNNKDKLIKFWYNGTSMTDKEVTKLKASLVKVKKKR